MTRLHCRDTDRHTQRRPYDLCGILVCGAAFCTAALTCSWPLWLRVVIVFGGIATFFTCLVAGSEPFPFDEE